MKVMIIIMIFKRSVVDFVCNILDRINAPDRKWLVAE
jgi:hypothetical protein